ncbi:heavy metal translocating P-type ATPase [Litoribrevibacter albus]|uniref:Cation-transporting P-type ATPase n=1 Tax=Litoribrevibacter albus TaxID=1473156 RepID=A0AA37S837_9GAMM|nr:heavy metal translocating P-type ATPase [Litoribrevibacter albus]GLQ30084.1 cation-transporting P-type ATPase [Litoribrevibacter albus]
MQDRSCYHCGEPVPTNVDITSELDHQTRSFCCIGCQAVALTISGAGLDNYYQFRTKNAEQASDLSDQQEKYALYDEPSVQEKFCSYEGNSASATLLIKGITCAACVWLIEKHLEKIDGIQEVRVNLSTHRASITWDTNTLKLSDLFFAIDAIGYHAEPWKANRAAQQQQKESHTALIRLGIAGIGMMQVMMMANALYFGHYTGIDKSYEAFIRWASLFLSTPVVLYSAFPFFNAAIRDLKTKHLTMDVPVSIAIALAYSSSIWATFNGAGEVYFDSVCMFTFFLLLGRYFEMKVRHQNSQVTNDLIGLMPNSTLVYTDGEYKVTPTEQIKVGDRILVKAGHTIPSDAKVIEGTADVDESALTGEYLPVRKKIGDFVMGGTTCLDHPIEIEITTIGHQNTLNLVVELMNKAESNKPRIARIADTIASRFVAAVLITAVSVWGTWMFIDPDKAFWIALSVLVVTCPCALSLATPTAITAATSSLKRSGLIITSTHVLEGLPTITDILFDKTGTLTEGKLSISDIDIPSHLPESEALALAARLEAASEHPIARAFPTTNQPAQDIEITPGGGLSGTVDGKTLYIGHSQFIQEKTSINEVVLPDSHNWVVLADGQQVLAFFKVEDTLRADAKEAIQALRQRKINLHMLTGDRSQNAEDMARTLDIEHVHSGLTPQGKLDQLSKLHTQECRTLMIGDGINDIPVLASAGISIAMNEATDLAKTKSDMILMNGQLNAINNAFTIAEQCRKIIKQNLGWALIYNLIALPLAATGFIPPWAAAIGMSASSLVVVLNALRLRNI